MTDIELSKILLSEGHTFAAVNNGEFRISDKRGVAPILELIDTESDFLNGASVSDRVIGKAAAMLLCQYGVKEIYTPLISEFALEYFSEKKTKIVYDKSVGHIINRDGTDMCPMEKAVQNITNEIEAERLIRDKITELRRA